MTGRINNKIAGILIILVIIAAVWLIGYFLGLDESQNRTVSNNSLNQETAGQKKLTSDQLPKLPETPKVSASSNNLPILPK